MTTPTPNECAAEVHLRALADCIRHPERYDLSPRSLADVVAPEGAPPMQAHPTVNRWAAFTNDELAAVLRGMLALVTVGAGLDDDDKAICRGVKAELARRKDTP